MKSVTKTVLIVNLLLLGLKLVCGTFSSCKLSRNAQPLPTWKLLKGLYYAIHDVEMTYCRAWNVCDRQPGNTRLAILDQQDDFDVVVDYLESVHNEKQFWIDATRPLGTGDYTWGDGCPLPISNGNWKDGDPQEGEDGVTLQVYGDDSKFIGYPLLDDAPSFRPLCQSDTVPFQTPVNNAYHFTWVLLGSPTQLLGFSDQKESHDRALEVCTDQQMSLAILDTLYEDVTTYIQEQHSARDEAYWWVAATRFDPTSSFTWSNGEAVASVLWDVEQSLQTSRYARLHLRSGKTVLTGHSGSSTPSHFICQQAFADTSASSRQFSPGCLATADETSTSSALTSSPSAENLEAMSESRSTLSITSVMGLDNSSSEPITMSSSSAGYLSTVAGTPPSSTLTSFSSPGHLEPTTMASSSESFTSKSSTLTLEPTTETSMASSPESFTSSSSAMTSSSSPENLQSTTETLVASSLESFTSTSSTLSPSLSPENTELTSSTLMTLFSESITAFVTSSVTASNYPAQSVSQPSSPYSASLAVELSTDASTPVSSDSSQNRTSSVRQLCCCKCVLATSRRNLTLQQLEEEVNATRKELLLDKRHLSATTRGKVSISDSRPSAQATGATGIAFLVVVFLFIVSFDVTNVVKAFGKGSKQQVGKTESG